jgi:AraC-like DNA-binding protein
MTEVGTATSPQPEIIHLSSLDVDQARAALNRFYYPVAVGGLDGTDPFALDLQVIQLGPLTVGQLSLAAAVTLVAAELDGYHITLPIVGHVLARQGAHEVNAGPETAAVFLPGAPVATWHSARSVELDVKIDGPALEAELACLLGRPVEGRIDLPPSMTLADGPGQSWSRLVQLLRDELDHPTTLIQQPLIAEQVRHTVLSGLLLSVPHRYHEELTAPAQPGPPRAIRRAIDAIQDEPEWPFSVADLARVAGMSVRSLQEGFRRYVGYAPMAYLQQVRLGQAYESLRSADPARVTVAAVAHRWGFAHLGRFAYAYRARFGVSPSETLRDSN